MAWNNWKCLEPLGNLHVASVEFLKKKRERNKQTNKNKKHFVEKPRAFFECTKSQTCWGFMVVKLNLKKKKKKTKNKRKRSILSAQTSSFFLAGGTENVQSCTRKKGKNPIIIITSFRVIYPLSPHSEECSHVWRTATGPIIYGMRRKGAVRGLLARLLLWCRMQKRAASGGGRCVRVKVRAGLMVMEVEGECAASHQHSWRHRSLKWAALQTLKKRRGERRKEEVPLQTLNSCALRLKENKRRFKLKREHPSLHLRLSHRDSRWTRVFAAWGLLCCDEGDNFKIQVPWRVSRKKKQKTIYTGSGEQTEVVFVLVGRC